jgi:antitoxin component of MazEF toxin-antitoxin module
MDMARLTRLGTATGVVIPQEILTAAGLNDGDEVFLEIKDGKIEISKAEDGYVQAMAIGRAFNARYRNTMAELAR